MKKNQFDNKQLSIIIPNFNSEIYLEETLQSIQNQTNPKWECIIVDDGSSDSSPQIAKSYCEKDNRFKLLYRNREPKGESSCRNIGIENAQFDYVMFIDSDDLLVSDCVENRINNMQKNTDLLIHGTDYYYQDGTRKQIRTLKEGNDYLSKFLRFEFPWQVCSPTWNKDFLKKIGGFNESYVNMVDPQLHIRALKEPNINIIYKPEFRDTLYRKIPQRKDYKEDVYYYKMTSSLINLLKENIHNFKVTKYQNDVLYGVGRVLANLIYFRNNFKKNNNEIKEILQYINESGIITAKEITKINKILAVNKLIPKNLNQRYIRFLNRKLFIFSLTNKLS